MPGGYVYLDISDKTKQEQINCLFDQNKRMLPSDTDTIQILIELIKHPNRTVDEIVTVLIEKGSQCNPDLIKNLLIHHGLEKKIQNLPKNCF